MITAILALIGVLGASLIGAVSTIVADRLKRRDTEKDRHIEVMESIKELKGQMDSIELKIDETSTVQCRIRILRFADEIQHGEMHSKDHFQQILEDITQYEKFCSANPNFRNNITVASTQLITETYAKCLREDNFI